MVPTTQPPQGLSAATAGGQLFLSGGGFMPARLLLAPVGARLPAGVHAVAAVPATAAVVAAGGSASRGILRLPVGARLPPGLQAVAVVPLASVGGRATHLLLPCCSAVTGTGEPAGDDDDGETAAAGFKGGFYPTMASLGMDSLLGVDYILPSTITVNKPELAYKLAKLKGAIASTVDLAREENVDKVSCAIKVVEASYGVVELAHAVYGSDDVGLRPLPGVEEFIGTCMGFPSNDDPPRVMLGQAVMPLLQAQAPLLPQLGADDDTDADLMTSMFLAVAVSQAAAKTARARALYFADDDAEL